jgi:hypothetical protein
MAHDIGHMHAARRSFLHATLRGRLCGSRFSRKLRYKTADVTRGMGFSSPACRKCVVGGPTAWSTRAGRKRTQDALRIGLHQSQGQSRLRDEEAAQKSWHVMRRTRWVPSAGDSAQAIP